MKKSISYGVSLLMVLVLSLGFFAPGAMAADVTDPAVLDVIAQLEAIDTLQQMQDARSRYPASDRYVYGESNYDVTS